MSDYKKYVPFVLRWEGGYADHKNDLGGKTNRGITRGTFYNLCKRVLGIEPNDTVFNNLSGEDAGLFIKWFWDESTNWGAIESQMLAETSTGWDWGSGRWGRKHFQIWINIQLKRNNRKPIIVDGAIGRNTVKAVNTILDDFNEFELFVSAIEYRKRMFEGICRRNTSQHVFLRGWLNRLEDFSNRWGYEPDWGRKTV